MKHQERQPHLQPSAMKQNRSAQKINIRNGTFIALQTLAMQTGSTITDVATKLIDYALDNMELEPMTVYRIKMK